MLVTEVGNADHSYGKEEKERSDDLLKEAFRVADEERGASEHNEIQTFWANGKAAETVMVFRKYVNVEMLPTLRRWQNWRRVEVALIKFATKYNHEVSMLIYNTHQL